MRKLETASAAPVADTLNPPEPPLILGDDSAFATESEPEGLRYGEQPHPPGSVYHGSVKPDPATPDPAPPHGEISIG